MSTPEEKRWAKEARLRRQALKKASAPSSTNLFQARIRRTEFGNRPSGNSWAWALFFIAVAAAGVGYWMQRTTPPRPKTAASVSAPSPDLAAALQASSAPVVSPVNVSVPIVVAPPVAQAAAVEESSAAPHAVIPDTREWHGPTSGVHDARQPVIKGRNAWRALWEELGRDEAVPRVNFSDHMVVGIFLGARPGAGYEVQIGTPQETDRELLVPYHIVAPLPGSPLDSETTFPWQLRVIPRTSKAIHFAQDSASTPGPSH